MDLMHWHEAFSVGVQQIDAHHRRLFALINELIAATETKQEPGSLQQIFDAVVDYAQMHFRAEEALFQTHADHDQHRSEHLAFESYLASFNQQNPLDRPESAAKLLRHLTSWLRSHILQTDIGIFSQLNYRPREPQDAITERLKLLTLKPTVLIVEDSPIQRLFLRRCLEADDFSVLEARNGREAIALIETTFDLHLVITDLYMEGGSGFELIRAIRERQLPSVFIMVITESTEKEALVRSFKLGANDYLTKPIHSEELRLRIRNGMNLIRIESQDELIFAMASLADCRSPETGRHLERVQSFCRLLSQELLQSQPDMGLSESMVMDIWKYSPLHDIGKVAIPDAILNKPGRLTPEEFEIMKEHARIGGDLIGAILRKTGSRSLSIAYDLTMHHHERWDGTGYPSGLSEEDIPIAARIMALADVYDALTSNRVYKPAFTRQSVQEIIFTGSGIHFDPKIVAAFKTLEPRFHEIREELKDA